MKAGSKKLEAVTVNISQTIQPFYETIAEEHHRDRSWEHCYSYFRRNAAGGMATDRHQAALQMAFYLASWGMYRGSSFLLQYAYTVHLPVVDMLGESRFSALWETEFGAGKKDQELISKIEEVIDGIRAVYRPFAPAVNSHQPTDTLITKIILGTTGCLPACDRYFIDGFKSSGFSYSCLNRNFVERVLRFCQENLQELREEQERIMTVSKVHYPLMKLVDMYFWQIGSDKEKLKLGK